MTNELPKIDFQTPPKPTNNPMERAQYFLGLIKALGQQGSPDFKKLQLSLMKAVVDYSEEAKDSVEIAATKLGESIKSVELDVAELVLKTTTKIRDRVVSQAKKSGAGDLAASSAAGLNKIIEAMEAMKKGVLEQDEELQAKAQEMMDEAQQLMGKEKE